MRCAPLVPALFFASIACGKTVQPSVLDAQPVRPDAQPVRPHFEVGWSPSTGRGQVVEHLANGDTLSTCFHCAYPGYTGGLVIGNLSASGMAFHPREPIRGYSEINVFCAQDESIWDLDEDAEYTYGWSENFGDGPDGKALKYQGGKIIEHDDRHVVLASENEMGCYHVSKIALTHANWRYWIIATRVQNRCGHAVRFHFHSGDDPWLGRYASSDGDVGWTPDGLVHKEKGLVAGQFIAGGIYDLGNSELGQTDTGFSNQANFFALDPSLPLPNFTAFANRFAHEASEVDPKKPLDNKTMTALNLGWRNRTLAPKESFTVTMALGLANTGVPGSIPQLPPLSDEAWSQWRVFLPLHPSTDDIRFAAERVELDVTDHSVTVDASYVLSNPSLASVGIRIAYPILVAKDRPAPDVVLVDGQSLLLVPGARGQVQTEFPISIPPQGIRSFHVRYTQRLLGHQAVYLVTSALRWPHPIDRAIFVIRYPARFRAAALSYPVLHRETVDGQATLIAVMQPFRPDREIVFRWSAKAHGMPKE
jgi:hypothetical protein